MNHYRIVRRVAACAAISLVSSLWATMAAGADDFWIHHGGTFFEVKAQGTETTSHGPCPQTVCTSGHVCSCLTLSTSLSGASGTEDLPDGAGDVGTLSGALTVDTTATTPKGEVKGHADFSLVGRTCGLPPNTGAAAFATTLQGIGGKLTDGVDRFTVSAASGLANWNDDGRGNVHLFGHWYVWVKP